MQSEKKRLSVKDYEVIFGVPPSDATLQYITDHVVNAFNRKVMTNADIIERIPMDWLELLNTYNERVEQYENCIILTNIINSQKLKNAYGGY